MDDGGRAFSGGKPRKKKTFITSRLVKFYKLILLGGWAAPSLLPSEDTIPLFFFFFIIKYEAKEYKNSCEKFSELNL
jgi:hypothetical protein